MFIWQGFEISLEDVSLNNFATKKFILLEANTTVFAAPLFMPRKSIITLDPVARN